MRKFFLFFLTVLMVLPLSVIPAGAATAFMTVSDFDKVSVEQDLAGTTIGGVKFNPTMYGYDAKGKLQILTFLEFGYGNDETALYLYLYNPQDLAVSKNDLRHAVTVSLAGGDYNKYTIRLLSAAGTEQHSRLYLKFKVDISSDQIKAAFKDQTSRTYRIGEIELVSGTALKSYAIGGEWTYRGSSTTGDLSSEAKLISVINLHLESCVYRGANVGLYQYDQINSVYFSMPKNFEEENGKITAIKCTWTEYDTGWILACKTKEVYDLLSEAAGVKLDGHNEKWPSVNSGDSTADGPMTFSWNPWPYVKSNTVYFADTLQWVVKYDGGTASYGAMVDSNLEGQLNAAWDAYKKQGAVNYFSQGGTEKTVDILSDEDFFVKVDDGSNWWDRIWSKNHGLEDATQKAFQRVTENALKDPEAHLFVDESYTDDLRRALNEATANDEELMLLHFASCDYRAIPVIGQGSLWDSSTWVNDGKEDMYACREQVYMGFDIIQFTCEKDGERVIVPVSAAPINVIGGLQFFAKDDGLPAWVILLIIVLALMVILTVVSIFAPVLRPILKAVVWVISLPFRLLWLLIKSIGKGISKLFHKKE